MRINGGPKGPQIVEVPKRTGIIGQRRIAQTNDDLSWQGIELGENRPICKPWQGYEQWKGAWDEPDGRRGPLLSLVVPIVDIKRASANIERLAGTQWPVVCVVGPSNAQRAVDRVLRVAYPRLDTRVASRNDLWALYNAGLWCAGGDYIALLPEDGDGACNIDEAAQALANVDKHILCLDDGTCIVRAPIAAAARGLRKGETLHQFAQRITAQIEGNKSLRVLHVLPHLNGRGAQVVALRIIKGVAAHHIVTAPKLEGELREEFAAEAKLVAWTKARAELWAADVLHFHWAGWVADISTWPRHTVVTEHLVNRRYRNYMRGGLTVVPWQCRRPTQATLLPEKFMPQCIEIPNPIERQEVDSERQDAMVLGVTTAEEYKGIREWVEAARLIWRVRQDVRFVLCGPRRGEAMYTWLQQRISDLRRQGMAIELRNFVNQAELAELYKQARVLLHMSRTESAGLAVLEAQMAGVPVVGTAVGGMTQHIYCGALVPRMAADIAAATVLSWLDKEVQLPMRELARHITAPLAYEAVYRIVSHKG